MQYILRSINNLALCVVPLAFLALLEPLVAQQAASRLEVDTSSLTTQERAVLEYLKKDWEKEYRTTSIAVAADALRVKLSDPSRLRLARFIEANRSAYKAPARHRTTTVALSPREKLVARAALLLEAKGIETPGRAEIAREMRVEAGALARPLGFLT